MCAGSDGERSPRSRTWSKARPAPPRPPARRRTADEAANAILEDSIQHPGRYPDDFAIMPIAVLPEILTPERVRLYEELRNHGPFASVNELAAALRRHQSRVSRDVALLEGHGLVAVEKVGRKRRVRAVAAGIVVV